MDARAGAASSPKLAETIHTTGELAVWLLHRARQAAHGLVHVAADEARAERLARILRGLAPDLDVAVLPAWDCLPYDRASPSRDVMGRRAAALRQVMETRGLVLTVIEVLVQCLPPRQVWRRARFRLRTGEPLRLDELESFLRRTGYFLDERVDEPGEVAIRGAVIDLFPAGAASPCRLEHAEGTITAIRRYDPVSQRSVDDMDGLTLEPVSEAILPDEAERLPGLEHWLPDLYSGLDTLFDYLPEAAFVFEPGTETRRAALMAQIADAYESRRAWAVRGREGARRAPVAPARLYVEEAEWAARLAERTVTWLEAPDAAPRPRFATLPNATRAFVNFVRDELAAGRRVVVAGAGPRDLRVMARRLERRVGAPEPAASWDAVLAAPAGALLSLTLDLDAGFTDQSEGVTVVAAADLLGSRAETGAAPGAARALPIGEVEFRLGDAVIHMEHGLGALRGLEAVTVADTETGDVLRLDYADDATLMVPVKDIGKIWRYGADAGAIALDRLDSDAWAKRRLKVEAEIRETARRMTELARARQALSAPVLVPSPRDYERFAARFPFSLTRDQARAIDETLADLASGRPMDRLVCGDVGFGKTEVALRAAFVAAIEGKQVAVVAPTTVLARQHIETFRRRFAGFGIEVAHLSRLVTSAEARDAKEGLADGRFRIVVGTHALAGKGVRFQDLGLLIVDEEQRFGARQKAKLRALGRGLHVLTLTATPIPRTLGAALVGLQELSVIATPPARRQPIRTFLIPVDAVTIREALLRERRRDGQSFVVCPRVEDVGPMAARLGELVPELEIVVAHGRMPAAEIDDVMVRFAEGEGDVLLATNIIESGLDVPRANTILVWRADRFGLSQLHQLRGRVGRGRLRGVCYMLTDPAKRISAATRERLRTLEALDRLGAGFAISARDLDLRGAGDLLGEEQAGHVKLIGIGLYRHLLERALDAARGEDLAGDWSPELNIGAAGLIPADYVPEPEVRINLYSRLDRLRGADELDAIAAEIEDRFGPMPDSVNQLLMLARLRALCREAGVAKLDAGPQAVALTFRPGPDGDARMARAIEEAGGALERRGERLVAPRPSESVAEQLQAALELLEALT